MKDKKQILYLDNFREPYLGGGEIHLLTLIEAVLKENFNVLVVCPPSSGLTSPLDEMGVETIPLKLTASSAVSDLFHLKKVLKTRKAEILHTHGFFPNNLGRLAGKLARTPVIVSTVHCEPDSTLSFDTSLKARVLQKIRDAADRFTSRYANVVIAVAGIVKEKLIRIGIPQEKVVLIRNGISAKSIREASVESRVVPSSKKIVVGTVGRLEPVKGFDYFIEAAALVKSSFDKETSFTVVGEGSLREHLEDKVKELGLENKVTFTGYAEDTLSQISKMDVFVAPSLSDTTNLALIEALALGKAVVATEVGGIPELISDKKTGLLVPPRNAKALAEAIIYLLTHKDQATKYALAGERLVKEEYTAEKMIKKTLNLYDDLLDEKTASN